MLCTLPQPMPVHSGLLSPPLPPSPVVFTPQESRAALAAAEARAAETAKAGAARRLKDAEARVEALEGTVGELRAELERQVGKRLGSGHVGS